MSNKFEEDIQSLKERVVKEYGFATDLYNALCNMQWQNKENPKDIYSCSWRYAGGLVAEMKENYEPMNYMEFYCSGYEGQVSEEVEEELDKLGWKPLPYDN